MKYPILHTPTLAIREAAIRAIYQNDLALGHCRNVESALRQAQMEDVSYIGWDVGRLTGVEQFWLMSTPVSYHVLVNSPAHLVSCVKRLLAARSAAHR